MMSPGRLRPTEPYGPMPDVDSPCGRFPIEGTPVPSVQKRRTPRALHCISAFCSVNEKHPVHPQYRRRASAVARHKHTQDFRSCNRGGRGGVSWAERGTPSQDLPAHHAAATSMLSKRGRQYPISSLGHPAWSLLPTSREGLQLRTGPRGRFCQGWNPATCVGADAQLSRSLSKCSCSVSGAGP